MTHSAQIIPFVPRNGFIRREPINPPQAAPLAGRRLIEATCLTRAAEATDPDAQRIWRNQADWIALSLRTSQIYLPPLPDAGDDAPIGTFDTRRREGPLFVIAAALLVVATLVAILPAWWA